MTKLLANRCFRWTLLALALSGLGVGIYRFTPPEPRWEVETGRHDAWHFASRGNELVMLAHMPDDEVRNIGALQKRNVQNGELIARYLANQPPLVHSIFSNDGSYFAAVTTMRDPTKKLAPTSRIHLVDFAQNETHELPLPSGLVGDSLHFSNSGKTLAWGSQNGNNTIRIYDSVNARLLDVRKSDGMLDPPVFTDEWLAHIAATNMDSKNIEIYNPLARRQLALLENIAPVPFGKPECPYFVFGKFENKAFTNLAIWNLNTNRLETEFPPSEHSNGPRLFTPNGRFTVCDFYPLAEGEPSYVEVRELPIWKQTAKAIIEPMSETHLSADGRFLAIMTIEMNSEQHAVTMFEMPNLKLLWQQKGVIFNRENPFNHDSNSILLSATERPEDHIYDCATGERRTVISALLDRKDHTLKTRLTSDRRFLLFHQQDMNGLPALADMWKRWIRWLPGLKDSTARNDTVVVVDMESCRELIRLQGLGVERAVLSDDGRTLVTTHLPDPDLKHRLRCWDVNAWKPLRWALGVPVGLAAAIGLFAWWRGPRASRTPVAKTEAIA